MERPTPPPPQKVRQGVGCAPVVLAALMFAALACLPKPAFAQQLDSAISSAEAVVAQLRSLKASGTAQPTPQPGTVIDIRTLRDVFPKVYRRSATIMVSCPGTRSACPGAFALRGTLSSSGTSYSYRPPATGSGDKIIFPMVGATDVYDVFVSNF